MRMRLLRLVSDLIDHRGHRHRLLSRARICIGQIAGNARGAAHNLQPLPVRPDQARLFQRISWLCLRRIQRSAVAYRGCL